MKKATSYLLALFVLIGVSALVFNQELSRHKEVDIEDALVRVEDLSEADLYIRYQETISDDYYDLPTSPSPEISKTATNNLGGDYRKNENQAMWLTSKLTKYVDNANPHLEEVKKTIANNLGNWQLKEEFVPTFETSSFYEYRECAQISQPDGKEGYMICVVSSTIREYYLYVLILHIDGVITKDEAEYILEMALKDKQTILERLP